MVLRKERSGSSLPGACTAVRNGYFVILCLVTVFLEDERVKLKSLSLLEIVMLNMEAVPDYVSKVFSSDLAK